jgi:hypothetical protein
MTGGEFILWLFVRCMEFFSVGIVLGFVLRMLRMY